MLQTHKSVNLCTSDAQISESLHFIKETQLEINTVILRFLYDEFFFPQSGDDILNLSIIMAIGVISGLSSITNEAIAIPKDISNILKLSPNIEKHLILLPRIKITEAYATAGCQNNGICRDHKLITTGENVYEGQKLQFRADFVTSASTITRVHCAIDGIDRYASQCSTPFEGKAFLWILSGELPINMLRVGEHIFRVSIDTIDGTSNSQTFKFLYTREGKMD